MHWRYEKLPLSTRVQILSMLVEGIVHALHSRITGVSINSVTELREDAGRACAAYHDEAVVNAKARRVQAQISNGDTTSGAVH